MNMDDPLDDPIMEARPPKPKGRPKRLKRSESGQYYVRVPLAWLKDSRVFDAKARIFLMIWHRSFEGEYRLTVTNDLAQEINIPTATKKRAITRLEDERVIGTYRYGNRAPDVEVLLVNPLSSEVSHT
jgi:hypothetical protein